MSSGSLVANRARVETAEKGVRVKDKQMGSEAGGRGVPEWRLKTHVQVDVSTLGPFQRP